MCVIFCLSSCSIHKSSSSFLYSDVNGPQYAIIPVAMRLSPGMYISYDSRWVTSIPHRSFSSLRAAVSLIARSSLTSHSEMSYSNCSFSLIALLYLSSNSRILRFISSSSAFFSFSSLVFSATIILTWRNWSRRGCVSLFYNVWIEKVFIMYI